MACELQNSIYQNLVSVFIGIMLNLYINTGRADIVIPLQILSKMCSFMSVFKIRSFLLLIIVCFLGSFPLGFHCISVRFSFLLSSGSCLDEERLLLFVY